MSGQSDRMPTFFLPHGGGPCFFMEWTMGPPDTWDELAAWLAGIPASLPDRPQALLVISAHWEEQELRVTSGRRPGLIYDYYGFPPHTYELQWPAPGAPELAAKVSEVLGAAGLACGTDPDRGFDHGVFVPLKVAFPDAEIPTVQLSLRHDLDPAYHLDVGAALAPLRDEGVLVLGSGLSYHNLDALMTPAAGVDSRQFDRWLADVCTSDAASRRAGLLSWAGAPHARACHPREEHLIPLMVAAGAAGDESGHTAFRGEAMGAVMSAFRFGTT